MIAILTENPILARMLTLEVTRLGFSLSTPDNAGVLMLDFDRPPRYTPPKKEGVTVIGFSAKSNRHRADIVLPLPYSSRQLCEVLCQYKSVKIDDTKAAAAKTKHTRLSPAEAKIFGLLLENEGQTVTKEALQALFPEGEASSNVLSVHIYRLRQKLSSDGVSYIRAVRGVGYRLCKSQGSTEK